jgi:Na+/phosphate symporter
MSLSERKLRLALMAFLVLLSEAASYWHLQHAFSWGHASLAPLVALAVIGLLIATIVGATLDPSSATKRLLFFAGAWLLVVQSFGVISSTALTAETELPADSVGRFWGLSAAVTWRAASILFGGTLSMVTLVFWDVLAKTFHSLVQEDRQADEDFQEEAEQVRQFRRKQ